MDYLLVLIGLVALFFGGEWLVKGAIALAHRLGLPTILISLTVVGFGTSTPELLVSVRAALAGSPDIALGNVIGSNTANILLIGGLAALIWPISKWDASVLRDAVIMLAVALLALFLVQFDVIGRLAGMAMVATLVLYIWSAWQTGSAAGGDRDEDEAVVVPAPVHSTVGLIAIGLVSLFAGAEALVRGATAIARDLGISEAVIGLTIVAVGTSLPELATSAIAALRRHSDVAVGNIVGSNIFNVLGILGLTAVIAPVGASGNFATWDAPVMVAASVLLLALLLRAREVSRMAGAGLLALYAAYVATLLTT